MHYLDSAATSWPKPEIVYQTHDQALRQLFSAKRGTAQASHAASTRLDQARQTLAELINVSTPSRIAFTSGCTHSLNIAIQAFPWRAGDGIVISALEHHALSRPVRKVVRERQLELFVVPYTDDEPFVLEACEALLRHQPNIRMIAAMHASNVLGCILPVEEIGRLAKKYDKYFLLDAAQSAGVLPIDVPRMRADIVALPAHKSLYGPPGVGALYVAEQVPLQTFIEGGTGSDTGENTMVPLMPDEFEVGTMPLPQILAMAAGARWVKETGMETIRAHETKLLEQLLDGLRSTPDVMIYGHIDTRRKTPVVSFNLAGWHPKRAGEVLFDSYGIALRTGFHCAPMAHMAIGTLDGGGTIRASLGYYTTSNDVQALLTAVRQLVATPEAKGALRAATVWCQQAPARIDTC